MHATANSKEIEKFSVKKGDVIVTKDSETPDDIGIPSYVQDEIPNLVCGYHLSMIRPNESILSGDYLAYYLRLDKVKRYFAQSAGGSTRFGLGNKSIEETKISFPVISEQKKIAAILTSVDEVIENTQAQIAKLEDLKRAMMNELLTKGIGHTEFKETEIGRIPKSWEIKSIGDIGKVVTGSTPDTSNDSYYNGRNMFVSPSDISDGMFVHTTSKTLTDDGFKKIRVIPEYSIMVVCIGSTIGKVALTTKKCATNQQINTIVPIDNDPIFIYYLMKHNAKLIKKESSTQAVPLLNKTDFSNIKIKLPLINEQKIISKMLHTIDSKIESLKFIKNKTNNLRKSLMQDLLTGKVRVSVN
jgi:type I restriction enzyme S subunit